jgi:hypothetical protein
MHSYVKKIFKRGKSNIKKSNKSGKTYNEVMLRETNLYKFSKHLQIAALFCKICILNHNAAFIGFVNLPLCFDGADRQYVHKYTLMKRNNISIASFTRFIFVSYIQTQCTAGLC